MLGVAFAKRPIRNFEDAKTSDHGQFAAFFHSMLDRGVWLPPSSYEAWFISAVHTEADVERAVTVADAALGGLA